MATPIFIKEGEYTATIAYLHENPEYFEGLTEREKVLAHMTLLFVMLDSERSVPPGKFYETPFITLYRVDFRSLNVQGEMYERDALEILRSVATDDNSHQRSRFLNAVRRLFGEPDLPAQDEGSEEL